MHQSSSKEPACGGERVPIFQVKPPNTPHKGLSVAGTGTVAGLAKCGRSPASTFVTTMRD